MSFTQKKKKTTRTGAAMIEPSAQQQPPPAELQDPWSKLTAPERDGQTCNHGNMLAQAQPQPELAEQEPASTEELDSSSGQLPPRRLPRPLSPAEAPSQSAQGVSSTASCAPHTDQAGRPWWFSFFFRRLILFLIDLLIHNVDVIERLP